MLSQTYISKKTQATRQGKLPKAKYVYVTMAFNSHLAPSKEIYNEYVASGNWDTYTKKFNDKILSDPVALKKIDQLILDSLTQDVVLICFESEKNYGNHCHRFLLLDIAESRSKEKGISVKIRRENYLEENK